MIPSPSILIVDNDPNELKALARGMWEAGIPFKAAEYSLVNALGEGVTPSSSIRALFVDLNLADAPDPSAETLVPHIKDVIKSAIASGPYVLVFWSKHPELADATIQLLRQRHPEITQPLKHTTLDKTALILPADNDPKFAERLQQLKQSVLACFTIDQALLAIGMWEDRIRMAASKTVSELFSTLPKVNDYNRAENFGPLLAYIARAAVGEKYIADAPERGLEEALIPLLQDELISTPISTDYRTAVSGAMSTPRNARPAPPYNSAILNKFYLIDSSLKGVRKTDRGAWVDIGHIDNEAFTNLFGRDRHDFILTEFLHVSTSGLTPQQKSDTAEMHLQRAHFGLIEISAGCDHAQKKQRLYKYVLAAAIPDQDKELLKWDGRDRRHEGIFRFPVVHMNIGTDNTADYFILVNTMYSVGLNQESPCLGEVRFRIKEPLLNQIANHYAKHHTRPGIISFQ